jgi:hypothetical protein
MFAVLVDIAGAAYAVRNAYSVKPVFARHGLNYLVQYDGDVWVGTLPQPGKPTIRAEASIVAIDGRPISPHALVAEITRKLESAPGPVVAVDLKQADGTLIQLQQRRLPPEAVAAWQDSSSDLLLFARVFCALLACAALLICALLLALRRPSDPVAMLFALAFTAMAATIDPPLQLWMGLGLSEVDDGLAAVWFYLLLVALATFPDGIFVPRFYRWLLVLGVPLAIFISLPDGDADVQALLGVSALLAMLIGQVRRYRRLQPGIERQQIKWAAFGFVVGLVLLLAAFILVALLPEHADDRSALSNLAVLVTFSLGMATLPLGLLVALSYFRLWEADTVITRSAAYAVVTLIVGVVWAASADLIKLLVSDFMGRHSEAGATAVSAIVAASVFSPAQSVVLGWTRRRFGGPLDRINNAAQRLKNWGLSETPQEIGTRALGLIDEAVHPAAAAIVLDTPRGQELIAASNADGLDDPRLTQRIRLEDEEGGVGTLLLGRRSDGNRYNRQQLEAVREFLPNLADALRVARSRYSRDAVLQDRLEEMAARLAQLEAGPPRAAPA